MSNPPPVAGLNIEPFLWALVDHTEQCARDAHAAARATGHDAVAVKAAAKAEGRYQGVVEVLYNYLAPVAPEQAGAVSERMHTNLAEWGPAAPAVEAR